MDGDRQKARALKRAKRIRETSVHEFRPPLQGEDVLTPDGEGEVQHVDTWSDAKYELSDREKNTIASRLGDDFPLKYHRVTVKYPEGDTNTQKYDIWEVDYDMSERLAGAPWRG